MANTDTPFGLRPLRHLNGNPWNGQFNMYYLVAAAGADTFIGDPVRTAGSADTLGKYGTLQQAAAGEALRGVVIGFSNTPHVAADVTNLSRVYRPLATGMYVAVVDDPDVIFEIQEDDNIAATGVGTNFDLVRTSNANTVTGLSGFELDAATTTTSAATCRLLGLVDTPGNAIGDYAKWAVLIIEHELRSTTGI